MAIQANQIQPALSTIGQLVNTLNTMTSLLNEAQVLISQNWVVPLSPGITITLTADQQMALVSQYDSLKTQLVTIFQQMP